MKVGDLVRYDRDQPTSYAEFQLKLKVNDFGLIVDTLRNGTTVKVHWIKTDQQTWIGKKHLEVVSERQEAESD